MPMLHHASIVGLFQGERKGSDLVEACDGEIERSQNPTTVLSSVELANPSSATANDMVGGFKDSLCSPLIVDDPN